MRLQLAAPLLVAFLLAMARAGAWILVAPPFAGRLLPTQVKTGLAAALALAAAPRLAAHPVPLEAAPLVGAAALQVTVGLALGLSTLILLSAAQAAGELIDLAGGFSAAQALDPLTNLSASVFGRFYQLLATTVLFVIGGHLVLVRGFLASFAAVGLSAPALGELSRVLLRDLAMFLVAALEIAGPLLAALFLTDIVLGLLSRAAPQLNVFSLGFALKIAMTLLLAGVALTSLPGEVGSLLEHALRAGAAILRALGG
jgi:flagellar biosynthetic protein FliR